MKGQFPRCAAPSALVAVYCVALWAQPAPAAAPQTSQAPSAPAAGAAGTSNALRTGDPPEPTGTIRGRVVRVDTGEPLRRVEIRAIANEARAVLTDENGRYELTTLPPGSYLLSASKGGYADVQYGQRRAGRPGRPLTVSSGQSLSGIDFSLTPGAVVTGRILDDAGEPIVGATVSLLQVAYVNGRRQLTSANGGSTDDRGEFRVFGIVPGNYYVRASQPPAFALTGASAGFVPTYYPGTASRAQAQRVTATTGEELTGITFPLERTRTLEVSGMVRAREGSSAFPSLVILRDLSDDAPFPDGRTAAGVTRPDGSFVVGNVAPGTYRIDARSMDGATVLSGVGQVTVSDRNVTGVVIEIGRGATARGRIRFDTGRPPRDLAPEQVRVSPLSLDRQELGGDPSRTETHEDWTFEVSGLTGQRLIRASAFRGEWTMKSVHVGGVDMTDTAIDFAGLDVDGVEIVLTRQKTEISGVVRARRGEAVNATVVVFADDREKWGPLTRFIRSAQLDQNGRYTVRELPPGSYVAVALDDIEPGEEADLELLEQLRTQGTRLRLADGEARVLNLELTAR